jgi:hypothetical protein
LEVDKVTHPITPPPELVRHWSRFQGDTDPEALWFRIANEAAQWGADQELETCCEWLNREGWSGESRQLRAARRPEPPSLKEQALAELEKVDMLWDTTEFSQETLNSLDTIRRALEQLDD